MLSKPKPTLHDRRWMTIGAKTREAGRLFAVDEICEMAGWPNPSSPADLVEVLSECDLFGVKILESSRQEWKRRFGIHA